MLPPFNTFFFILPVFALNNLPQSVHLYLLSNFNCVNHCVICNPTLSNHYHSRLLNVVCFLCGVLFRQSLVVFASFLNLDIECPFSIASSGCNSH